MKIGAVVLAVSILVAAGWPAVRGRIRRARNGFRAVNAARVRRRRLIRSRGAARQGQRQPLDLLRAA
ncbi:hypothetical protein ACIA8C_29975 [Nocardia sp. NPDC051321]|uniref:hypothetical protein n=1 Tax=Nocardia sp. NPDC051321 TaxID=3364323 RepID=UPI003792EEC1